MMFAMLTLCTSFSSCGSDDDDEPTVTITSPVVGIWEISIIKATLNLTSSGKIYLIYKGTSSGTYETTNGNDCIIKVSWDDGSKDIWEYKITGNKMSIKSFSGTDLTWTRK